MVKKLEKKFGKYAIKNLIYYILGGYVIGYLLLLLDSRLGWYQWITMDAGLVMKGQVWRLFTWICTVPQGLSIWVIFMFLLYFFIGKSLENSMGAFRYNLFMIGGWFFMTLGSMVVYWITNGIYGSFGAISMQISTYYINLASFLAFAVLFPNQKVYFFGILPVKIKWLAWIDVAYLGITIISCIISLIGLPMQEVQDLISVYGIDSSYAKVTIISQIFSIVISLLNFLIFFISNRKDKPYAGFKQKRKQAEFKKKYNQGLEENKELSRGKAGKYTSNDAIVHRCSTCGRTNLTNPELSFRYCSKCNGNHEYCQDHLFTHVHIK